MFKRSVVAGAIAGLTFGLIGVAYAAPAYDASSATSCLSAGGTNAGAMQLSDVTFSGNQPSTSADDCFGIVVGNDSEGAINAIVPGWGTGWQFLVKDDGVGNTFGGLHYALSITNPGTTAGSWTLTAGPTEQLPAYLDIVAVLKGSKEFALWFFDDVRIDAAGGGDWQSVFTNKHGNLQALSHMSLYVRQGTRPPEIPPPNEVPEPSALLLSGLALAAAGIARRRRGT